MLHKVAVFAGPALRRNLKDTAGAGLSPYYGAEERDGADAEVSQFVPVLGKDS